MGIEREIRYQSVALTTSLGTTPIIDYNQCVSGMVHLPSTSATLLTWYASATSTGTFVACYDSAASPAAVTQVVSGSKAYPIPLALAGAYFLKCVADVAVTVDITMKT